LYNALRKFSNVSKVQSVVMVSFGNDQIIINFWESINPYIVKALIKLLLNNFSFTGINYDFLNLDIIFDINTKYFYILHINCESNKSYFHYSYNTI
jgi:hypothetical protein